MRRLACLPLLAVAGAAIAQPGNAPVNDRPNPFRATLSWERLGRATGGVAGIDIDPDGRSVWIAERCGANSCAGSTLPGVLKLDPSGRVVKAFGAGLLVMPHGIDVDRAGNVWVTDAGLDAAGKRGYVVVKFSPEGKVLMTLGTPGVRGSGQDTFTMPCDVAVAPNGDIFVSDGHQGQVEGAPPTTPGRIVKFSRDGRFIKAFGTLGSGPGQFRTPHALAFDARGRLFVADRGNNRVQILDQDGGFIAEWRQFGRPSDIHIRGDAIYVSDSESNTKDNPGGWKRGIRIGSARTGEVRNFLPWLPEPMADAPHSGFEGVAADAAGNVYGANAYLRDFFPGGPWGEIRRFTPLTTPAAAPRPRAAGPGSGPAARPGSSGSPRR